MSKLKSMSKSIAIATICFSLVGQTSIFASSLDTTIEGKNAEEITTAGVGTSDSVSRMVNEGYLAYDGDGNIIITELYEAYLKESYSGTGQSVMVDGNTITVVSNGILGRSSTGVTKLVWYGVGGNLYLNNADSKTVGAGLGLGATLSRLIPDPLTAKIVGIALSSNATLVAYNNNGKGVVVSFINLSVPSVAWIKSQ